MAPGNGMRDILIYETEDRQVEVRLERETVWLNRQQMAELFGRDVKTTGKHINNVLQGGGAGEGGNCRKICDGSNRRGAEGYAAGGILQPRFNEEPEVIGLASQAGFRCFTSTSQFRDYVETDILGTATNSEGKEKGQ